MNSKQRKQAEHMKNVALAKLAAEGTAIAGQIEVLKLEREALNDEIARLRRAREALRDGNVKIRDLTDSVRDVLMLLKLEVEPAEVARQVRERYGMLGDW